MEYKLRRESQTLMEKVFNKYARRGSVKAARVPDMMQEMQGEIMYDKLEMDNMIELVDRKRKGSIDMEGFNKIALHFLLKQAKHDNDPFNYKHEICSQDFKGPRDMRA